MKLLFTNEWLQQRISADPDSDPEVGPSITGREMNRPTDEEIIEVLALHFRIHELHIIAWIKAMDLDAASKKIMEEDFK